MRQSVMEVLVDGTSREQDRGVAKRRSIATRAAASAPIVVLLGGPNGAGKTTAAPRLLRGALRVTEFLNADLIARGISPFDPEGAALAASDVLLRRMESLIAAGVSFGLESTLAARSLAPRMKRLLDAGYEFHVVFLYLPSADMAVERVAARVRLGGHRIPEPDVRRRYAAGLSNFFRLYQPLATSWQFFDNSRGNPMALIAAGRQTQVSRVGDRGLWLKLRQDYQS